MVRRSGGTIIVQDPTSATYPDMLLAALRAGTVDHVVPLVDIGDTIAALLAAGWPAPAPSIPGPTA